MASFLIRHRRRGEERNQLIMASFLFLLRFVFLFLPAPGIVSGTFSVVNSGKVRSDDMEYDANYRVLPLASRNGIFKLVFFNTTLNSYGLGISMGYSGQMETMKIVWTANRDNLVRENAILKYGGDGNLVLSNSDGHVVWSTKTSGKQVVGIELGNDGNLVLFDKLKKPVWQSFDHATDSLLVGQSLNIGGVKKLVSRAKEDGSGGHYSLAIEAGGLALYDSLPEPVPHWTLSFHEGGPRDIYGITHTCKKPMSSITFLSDPEAENGYRQMMEMRLANFTARPELRTPELCNLTSEETTKAIYGFNTPRFNTTLSFLRLESDGDLKMYTYSPHMELNKWDITYQRFGCWRGVPEFDLVRKFGGSMVASRRCQCLACGFKGSRASAVPSLPDRKDASSNSSSVDFYKLLGPQHLSSHHHVNANPIGETETEECRRKCSHDCAAFLHWEPSPECSHAATLGTLNDLGNRTRLVFIKKTVKKV